MLILLMYIGSELRGSRFKGSGFKVQRIRGSLLRPSHFAKASTGRDCGRAGLISKVSKGLGHFYSRFALIFYLYPLTFVLKPINPEPLNSACPAQPGRRSREPGTFIDSSPQHPQKPDHAENPQWCGRIRRCGQRLFEPGGNADLKVTRRRWLLARP